MTDDKAQGTVSGGNQANSEAIISIIPIVVINTGLRGFEQQPDELRNLRHGPTIHGRVRGSGIGCCCWVR